MHSLTEIIIDLDEFQSVSHAEPFGITVHMSTAFQSETEGPPS